MIQSERGIATLIQILKQFLSIIYVSPSLVFVSRHPESHSVVSSLRRGSILVAFAGGVLLFAEVNGRRKLPAVAGVLVGIVLTLLG